MSPELSDSQFFWRHAYKENDLYVLGTDITAFLRQWADNCDRIEGTVSPDDLRRTADELDAEWIGYTTEMRE